MSKSSKSVLFIILATFLLFSAHANNIKKYSPDRLIIKMKEGVTPPSLTNVIKVQHLFKSIYTIYSKNITKLEKELANNHDIIYIEKDYYGSRDKLEKREYLDFNSDSFNATNPFNDQYVNKQWTLLDSELNGISVKRAFLNRRTMPREEIIVAVVDTGVDFSHPDLPIWSNENEIPNNGIDDDGNGYIDDIYGINTLVRDQDGNATMNTSDAHGHGTHVSGSIGAIQNNNIGVVGVASNVKIMGIRTVPNRSDELDVDVIEAFIYAAKNGAKIINCSFGKSHNEGGQAVSEAIEYIGKEFGVLVVAAAGNSSRNIDTTPSYPASFTNDSLLVVASTSKYGGLSYFSNYGQKGVDVAAPGSGIYSTYPGNRYSSMSGTSMASPNTAGLAAEILSHFPNLTPFELKKIIMNSVTKIGSMTSRLVSGGRIDLEKSLVAAEIFTSN
ncbi:MAG: S8 family serine peptidase [Bdellovibrionales bacterium]|jgi:thermitase|nr:S8 family serine peptidase [Bdellovibrionales bacterium]